MPTELKTRTTVCNMHTYQQLRYCGNHFRNVLLLSTKIIMAKLQNTWPLIYISLNHKSGYCNLLRSSKDFDTCKPQVALHSVVKLCSFFDESNLKKNKKHFYNWLTLVTSFSSLRAVCIDFNQHVRNPLSQGWKWTSNSETTRGKDYVWNFCSLIITLCNANEVRTFHPKLRKSISQFSMLLNVPENHEVCLKWKSKRRELQL